MSIIMDRSALGRYADCPHQASLCIKHNIPLNDRLPVGGVLGHDVIDKAFKKHCIDQPDGGKVYELDKVAQTVVDELPKTRPDLSKDVVEGCKYAGDVIAGLANIPIVGVEMQTEATITPEEFKEKLGFITDQTVTITQCFDLVQYGTNSLHYRDWKTGYKKRTRADAEEEFQSACGAWLLMRNYDGVKTTADGQILPKIDTIHVWYHELRWRTTAYARFDRSSEDPAQSHLTTFKLLEYRILSAAKLWLEGSDEAWPEPKKCGFCSAVTKCKLADWTIKEVADNPSKYVDCYVAIKAKSTAMYKALKSFHQGYGRIEGSEVAFDWKPSPKYIPKIMPKVNKGPVDEDIDSFFK